MHWQNTGLDKQTSTIVPYELWFQPDINNLALVVNFNF